MFSGLMWTGQQSVVLGLADGFGTVDSVARDLFQAEKVIDYTMRRSLTDRIAKRFGSAMGDSLVAAVRGLRFY